MYLNAVIKLREYILTSYQGIKQHTILCEHFDPDHSHTPYNWNNHTFASHGHSLLLALKNDTWIRSYMSPQAYKVTTILDNEVSGWTIISRNLHARAPYLEGINGYVQYNSANLAFKTREKLDEFHVRVLRLQNLVLWIATTAISTTSYLPWYESAMGYSMMRWTEQEQEWERGTGPRA